MGKKDSHSRQAAVPPKCSFLKAFALQAKNRTEKAVNVIFIFFYPEICLFPITKFKITQSNPSPPTTKKSREETNHTGYFSSIKIYI